MKKLIYLFVAGTMFAFTACGGGETATEEAVETTTEETVEAANDSVEVVVACADDCQKACCLGCKATEGDATCIVLEDGSMPCCHPAEEAPHDESVPHTH